MPGEQGAQTPVGAGTFPAGHENFVHLVWSPLLNVSGGHGRLYMRLGGQANPAGQVLRKVACPCTETIRSPPVPMTTPDSYAPLMMKRPFPVELSKARIPAAVEMYMTELAEMTGCALNVLSNKGFV